jgi:lipopolysaccharide export system permease protein
LGLAPSRRLAQRIASLRTLRKLLYVEVLAAVALVIFAFSALFLFFDLSDELNAIQSNKTLGYTVSKALIYVALMIPSHLYELMPIAVLIGTIFVMARLAQSSEFTILRTSGLGPWQALRALMLLGLGFVTLTFALGDYLAPLADKTAQAIKAQALGQISLGRTGAWIKDKQPYSSFSVNVGALEGTTGMKGIRIFELDNKGHIVSVMQASAGEFGPGQSWSLQEVTRTEFMNMGTPQAQANTTRHAQLSWLNHISAEMVASALLRPERMGTLELFQYVSHLNANGQSAQKYEIQFWKKVFYPLSCLVMVMLALPFAYLHFRSSGTTPMVFVGVMAGISFVLLNNLVGDLGYLQGWQAWFTAALPGLIYSFISLAAFAWLVARQ